MKYYLIILVSVLAISCKTAVVKEKFPYPNRNEIVAIVKTIVTEKKLPVEKDGLDRFHLSLASDLEKLKVLPPDTSKEMFASSISNLTVTELLAIKVKGKNFFDQKDSTSFFYQNDTMQTIDLHDELEKNCYLTTTKLQNANKDSEESYYSMSIPVFSKDMKKAYFEVDDNCPGLCGSGGYYLLEKINNKWTIMAYQLTWIS